MTFPKKMPDFPLFKFQETIPCTYEDAVKDHEEMREFHEQAEKCRKARGSRIYSRLMSLAGAYERERTIN